MGQTDEDGRQCRRAKPRRGTLTSSTNPRGESCLALPCRGARTRSWTSSTGGRGSEEDAFCSQSSVRTMWPRAHGGARRWEPADRTEAPATAASKMQNVAAETTDGERVAVFKRWWTGGHGGGEQSRAEQGAWSGGRDGRTVFRLPSGLEVLRIVDSKDCGPDSIRRLAAGAPSGPRGGPTV